MNPKEELQELYEFKQIVEMRVFQKFIMEPLKKKIDSLKHAYDCKTLNEMATLKGEEKGLKYILTLLKQSENDLRNKKTEVDQQD
jgi:hypothetical protein